MNEFIDTLANLIGDITNSSNETIVNLSQIRKEFPTTLPVDSLILTDDPGSVCSDFIQPLISAESVVGTVIDGILEKTFLIIPQIGDIDELPDMLSHISGYIEHDLQETSVPRLVIKLVPNIPGAPEEIKLYATQVTRLEMCEDPTEVKVEKMEVCVDQFQLEAITLMLQAIQNGNVIKAPVA
jgi:hypothetical protein